MQQQTNRGAKVGWGFIGSTLCRRVKVSVGERMTFELISEGRGRWNSRDMWGKSLQRRRSCKSKGLDAGTCLML